MTTKAAERRAVHGSGKDYWKRLGAEVRRDKWLYLLLLPGFVYFVVFKYLPLSKIPDRPFSGLPQARQPLPVGRKP